MDVRIGTHIEVLTNNMSFKFDLILAKGFRYIYHFVFSNQLAAILSKTNEPVQDKIPKKLEILLEKVGYRSQLHERL